MTGSAPAAQNSTANITGVQELSPGDPWSISIKTVGGDIDLENGGEMNSCGERQFTVQVSPEDHLDSLHDQIEASTGLKASQQRLIYRGRIIGGGNSSTAAPVAVAPATTPPEEAMSDKQTHRGDSSTDTKTQLTKIKDIAGLADGQTIHLVKRRDTSYDATTADNEDVDNRGTLASTQNPMASFIPSDGAGGDGATGEIVSTGGLLATLLGLSSLTDDNEESSTRRWARSRLGRSNRRPHYRMTTEDRQVPDPGSMEPVRQGLMTLNTLLPHLQSNDMETPIESNRRWYRGQWLDCLDTVNAWLEATVVELMAPEEILPQAYDRSSSSTPLHRREPQLHNDPAVSASDLEGRRRLLLEPCDPNDEHDVGGELSGFRPRSSNRGVQLLLIHYNGWPHRWDEWIRSDSARLRPFRTRTRHPNVSSTASPTPQSVFHEAPRTNILAMGDDDEDRGALLPELARAMSSVNDILQRQVSHATETTLTSSADPSVPLATSLGADLPWISALRGQEPTLVEDLIPPNEGQAISNILQHLDDSDDEQADQDFDYQNEVDSVRLSVARRRGGESTYDGAALEAAEQRRRRCSERNSHYTRQELQNLATLLDRLGRTLTDAAPHIASLAANLPSETEITDPDDAMMNEAIEEFAENFAVDSETNTNDSPIGGLLSLWTRERRNLFYGTSSLSSTTIPQSRRRRSLASATPSVDADHEDYVSGLVNTTRGEVRTGPRSRTSNDEVAGLLGAYLAAATLGNGSSADGNRDDGNSGLGQLLRGGAGGGGGIDIHIHAVVTGPGGTFGTGAGAATTAILGGTAIGGPRNLFSTNRRATSGSSVLRNRSRSGSFGGTRRRVAAFDEGDTGIFDELYSETPEPIDPNGSLGSNDGSAPGMDYSLGAVELHDPDDSESDNAEDYITGLNASYRSGSVTYHREHPATDEYLAHRSRQTNTMDHSNIGAATLAGRGVSSTRRRMSRGAGSRREPVGDQSEQESPRNRLSGLSRLFRRRSSRMPSEERH